MLLLALETSTALGGAALLEDGQLLAAATFERRSGHAETLHPLIDHIFSECQKEPAAIDAVAVGLGPGSFTALRVGLAAAKGLAHALQKPLIGVPTLELLCANIPQADGLLVPLLDARKKEVCGAVYRRNKDGSLALVKKQTTLSPTDFAAMLKQLKKKILLFGPGATLYQSVLKKGLGNKAAFLSPLYDVPRPAALGFLALGQFKRKAFIDPLTAVPVYLRPSEAELGWEKGGWLLCLMLTDRAKVPVHLFL